MLGLPVFFVATAACIGSALAINAPTATVSAGTLTGGICEKNPNSIYFKSIPYGEPPVGDLRLEPPQPYNASYPNGTRDATAPAPACIQFGGGAIAEARPWSEDCLFLDIWAPLNATSSSFLPVRVWIYGGANQYGGISDRAYDGCNVPDTGAIMVALNYRVGPFGFLAVKEAGIQGNQGIQDILLGLQWVKDNIAAFGGNPEQVMLHGQSAGATNTFTIASLPQAPNLFKAAIMESGGGRDAPLADLTHYRGSIFAQALGCSANDTACLKSAPVSSYHNVSDNLPLLNSNPLPYITLGSINGYGWGPYVDGEIVPEQPSEVGVQVPSIFGSTSLEGTFFALIQFFNGTALTVNASDYDTFLLSNFGERFVPTIKQYYPISAFAKYPYPAFYAISYVMAESSYLCSAYRGMQTALNNKIPVWNYYFAHAPSCSWYAAVPQSSVPLLQAAHTAEIPFMLGDTTGLPDPNGTCNMTPGEVAISQFMNTAWTNMAFIANPGDDSSWPEYTPEQALGLIIQNQTGPYPINQTRCELWDKINAFQAGLAANGTLGGANATNVVHATSASGGSEGSGSASGSASGSGSAASASASSSGSSFKGCSTWLAATPLLGFLLAFS